MSSEVVDFGSLFKLGAGGEGVEIGAGRIHDRVFQRGGTGEHIGEAGDGACLGVSLGGGGGVRGLAAAGELAITLGEPSTFLPGAPTSIKGRSWSSRVSSTAGAADLGWEGGSDGGDSGPTLL